MITIIGLYVHIPFCEKICSYCDFCKRVPKDDKMIWDYLHTLKREYETLNNKYDTIYIGGGTPSMLNNDQLNFLLEIFKDEKPLEYTIEVNPESYTKDKGKIFKKFGVNRISLGVQTFNKEHLIFLRRQHTNLQVFNTINHLNEIGLHNISVDLIFALPKQTINDILNDLNIIEKLKIKHISYYELVIEEKTIMHHLYKQGLLKPLDNEVQAEMYLTIINRLKELGYNQYEVSSFSKGKQYESAHNKLYWTHKPYDAIGAGSFGFINNIRYEHTNNVSSYIKDFKRIETIQDEKTLYEDYLIFGLRKVKGINLDECIELFKRNPLKDFDKFNEFIELGYLIIENNYLKVTQKGMLFLNMIVEVVL